MKETVIFDFGTGKHLRVKINNEGESQTAEVKQPPNPLLAGIEKVNHILSQRENTRSLKKE